MKTAKKKAISAVIAKERKVKQMCRRVIDLAKNKKNCPDFSMIISKFGENFQNNIRQLNSEKAIWPCVQEKQKKSLLKSTICTRPLA